MIVNERICFGFAIYFPL